MATLALPRGPILRPRITFMDCDGVIFDANDAKVAAFEVALKDEPADARAKLIAHHKATGGISRYEKLRRFYTKMVAVDDPEAAIAAALDRFSAASRAGYRRLTPRPEALRFAEAMGGAGSVFVVSGSDGDELREAFDHHRIRDRFADVLGSPTKKVPHLRRTLEARGIPPNETVMIGDGRGDLDACRALGIPFIFLREMSEWRDAGEHLGPDHAVAETWAELLSWLDSEGPDGRADRA